VFVCSYCPQAGEGNAFRSLRVAQLRRDGNCMGAVEELSHITWPLLRLWCTKDIVDSWRRSAVKQANVASATQPARCCSTGASAEHTPAAGERARGCAVWGLPPCQAAKATHELQGEVDVRTGVLADGAIRLH
jgi:hypothetical protein